VIVISLFWLGLHGSGSFIGLVQSKFSPRAKANLDSGIEINRSILKVERRRYFSLGIKASVSPTRRTKETGAEHGGVGETEVKGTVKNLPSPLLIILKTQTHLEQKIACANFSACVRHHNQAAIGSQL
jgi:hypothetical protein